MWGRFTARRARRSEAVERGMGVLGKVSGRFATTTTTSTRSEGRAYTNVVVLGFMVGFGISALVMLIVYLLLLGRRRAREEGAPFTPAPGEGAEAAPLEEEEELVVEEEVVVPPGSPSAEEVSSREQPPPGEERLERRGVMPTSPPREEPPPGEERPGRR